MKIFKSLLVAPAAIGLLAPMTNYAADLNLNDVSNYSHKETKNFSHFSDIYPPHWAFKAISNVAESRNCSSLVPSGTMSRFEAARIIQSCVQNVAELTQAEEILVNEFGPEIAVLKSRLDSLETRINNFEAGGFSKTTTASFSADFAIGAVDGLGISTGVTDGNEQLTAEYGFQIDLNTSFTGEDSLDIAIDAGNANGNAPLDEFDLNGTTDALTVDGISYSFPVGNARVIFGDNIDGSELFTTACAYSGPTDTLDDCGNVNAAITNGGAMVGMSYDFGSGFTGAFGYAGSETNIATNEGLDAYGFNVAYTADSYGVSVTYAAVETHDYIEDTFTAFNAYWSPEGLPSISAGFETGEDGSMADGKDGTTAWFVGLESSQFGPGTFGAAIGTQGSYGATDEELMYEAYYSYPVNDGMTVTPVVYIKEQATSGTPDQTGVMVKTSFSF